MKFSVSVVVSLLLSLADARPRASEEGDPVPQKSRVTAFVVDKNGNPSVECWEFSNMVESQQVKRRDGSKGTAYSMSLVKRELDGLDIITWPPYTPIWPPTTDNLHAEWFDFGDLGNLFSIQKGLITVVASAISGSASSSREDVFGPGSGDNWFYFEDSSSSTAKRTDSNDPPFQITAVSGGQTEVLRLRFPQQPAYTVVHKGGCSYSGIKTPDEEGLYDGARQSLVVQQDHDNDL